MRILLSSQCGVNRQMRTSGVHRKIGGSRGGIRGPDRA